MELSGIVFSALSPADVPAVAAIEKNSTPSPWSEAQFSAELNKPFSHFWVVKTMGSVAAFGGYWSLEKEAQLVEMAVHPARRREGLGRRLVKKILAEARAEGARRMTLEVREGNAPARRLYENMGFRATGRRARFYEGREDAVMMEKTL